MVVALGPHKLIGVVERGRSTTTYCAANVFYQVVRARLAEINIADDGHHCPNIVGPASSSHQRRAQFCNWINSDERVDCTVHACRDSNSRKPRIDCIFACPIRLTNA